MGLHRDGEFLGLGLLRSEERRRMWWQLQFMELMVASQIGTLSSGVMGQWDAKMPANIEDNELGPETTELPPARSSLTSMSNCLWKYNVLQFHRNLRNGDRNIPTVGETTSMMDRIAEMLRVKFVQHCELIDPLHVNIQLGICQIIVATRRLLHQPALLNAKISSMSMKQRDELLEVGMKNLEYCNLIQTTESLKGFRWNNSAFFPWAACMLRGFSRHTLEQSAILTRHLVIYVILEANHRSGDAGVKDIWRVISRTYENHDELRTSVHRQDVTFAARITATGWQKYQAHLQRSDGALQTQPQWIKEVYENFHLTQPTLSSTMAGSEDRSAPAELSELSFDMDLDSIDWSAWDAAFLDAGFFRGSG